MEIKIHRGLEQIGGCITEISTATSRVFIDLGQNLPGNGEEQTPEQDKLMVESLFKSNKKKTKPFSTHTDTKTILVCLNMFLWMFLNS